MNPKYLTLLALIARGTITYPDLFKATGGDRNITYGRIKDLKAAGYLSAAYGPTGKALSRTLRLTEAGQSAACGLLLTRCGKRVTGVYRIEWAEKVTEDLCQQ